MDFLSRGQDSSPGHRMPLIRTACDDVMATTRMVEVGPSGNWTNEQVKHRRPLVKPRVSRCSDTVWASM